ncbi:MAG: aldo/keto reductase [Oscillospiraceae bacterium]|nr:aldo/keto reductase [Oscillospiraceae bacterium]
MIYTDFKGKKLSTLGYGGMRLPASDSKGHVINEQEATRLFEHAYNNGVNYFDTAFFYHAGNSERVMGNALSRFERDTWYIADKFPGNFIDVKDGKLELDFSGMGLDNMTFNTPAEIFDYQLNKIGVDYFDFYMLHNVAESTYDLYTDEQIGLIEFLREQKRLGRIGHIGFSTHGRYETIEKFVGLYDCFEFALLQLNYLDWTLQEAGKKYDVLTRHGIPIFVMEPVRGGKLAAPGKDVEDILKAARPDDTPAKWAFRYLQSLPNVSVVVSGMSTMEQLSENIELFSVKEPLSESEKQVLEKAVDAMASFVPCTSCRYCCDSCPKELDIPMLIATYNEAVNAFGWYVRDVMSSLSDGEKPGACIACGACVPLCPQSIEIADVMAKFAALLESNK